MGTEAVWVPLVLAAVSTAATVYSTRQAAKKKDNALAAQIEASTKKEREASERANQLIDQQASSDPAAERQTALGQYIQALRSGGGAATAGLTAQKGAVSSRFAKEAEEAALGVSQYGDKQAGLFSVIDSARRQREREATERGRAAMDIDAISRRARAQDFLLGLKTDAVRRNPYLDAAAQFTGAYAGNMGAMGGTGDATGSGAILGGTTYGNSNLYQGGILS